MSKVLLSFSLTGFNFLRGEEIDKIPIAGVSALLEIKSDVYLGVYGCPPVLEIRLFVNRRAQHHEIKVRHSFATKLWMLG